MAEQLTDEEIVILRRLAGLKKKTQVCPNCAHREVDERSPNAWCVYCDFRRERVLESKRRYWDRVHGANPMYP